MSITDAITGMNMSESIVHQSLSTVLNTSLNSTRCAIPRCSRWYCSSFCSQSESPTTHRLLWSHVYSTCQTVNSDAACVLHLYVTRPWRLKGILYPRRQYMGISGCPLLSRVQRSSLARLRAIDVDVPRHIRAQQCRRRCWATSVEVRTYPTDM